MMFLSRIQLDTGRRETMKALAYPNLFHGAIEQSFSGPRRRNLWRVDSLGSRLFLLILSTEKPDFDSVAAQFGTGNPDEIWETRNYKPLLDRIGKGDIWHFRLTANPTVSKKVKDERGKVLGHITPVHQKQWLMDRAGKNGFILKEEEFSVTESRWIRFLKGNDGGRPVTLLSVTYEGILTVTEPEQFRQALIDGIGRGKAYGNGLLTIAGRCTGIQ